MLKHSEAEVIEVDGDGEFKRLVDPTEWQHDGFFEQKWGETEAPIEEVTFTTSKTPPKKKAAKKKVASTKKKTENKQTAIPGDDESLENIDVSSL